jgi:hypothetical protein
MIPKSLHSVTALVNVARHLIDCGKVATRYEAIAVAASVLGYVDGTADPHGLLAAALRKLEARS